MKWLFLSFLFLSSANVKPHCRYNMYKLVPQPASLLALYKIILGGATCHQQITIE
jgi:hypothetical protein